MKVLIVDNDGPALAIMAEELRGLDETIEIIGSLSTVEDGIRWLEKNPGPDLLILNTQLPDGPSFLILDACPVNCPIIFTSCDPLFPNQAFDYCAIDYLTKPFNNQRLANAVRKYRSLEAHFGNAQPIPPPHRNGAEKKRSRILVKKGMEYQPVRVEDTGYFFTEHKLVFLVDKENRKYMAEKNNLTELEDELDGNTFYRANRKYIINANYVKRFKPLERSKISVELVLPVNEEIIISQENSASFKKWIGEI